MKYPRPVSSKFPEFNFWTEKLLDIYYINGSYTKLVCFLGHALDIAQSGTNLIFRGNGVRDDPGFSDPDWILHFNRKKIDQAIGEVGEGFRMKGDGLGVVGKGGGTEPNDPNCQNDQRNFLDEEELLKKHIAINCLRAASEQNIGIEELINEICIQMKNSKVDSESPFVEPKIGYLSPLTVSYENVKAELDLYNEEFPSLNGGLKLEDEGAESHRKYDPFDPNLTSDEESGGSDKENFNDGFLQTLIGASNIPLYNTATVGFSTALRFYGSNKADFNESNGVFRLPSKEPDPNIWKNSPPLGPILHSTNKAHFSFHESADSSQLFEPDDVATGYVYSSQEQDRKVKYEDQAFGNDEVSSRSSGGENEPKVDSENSPSLDSQATALEPDSQDSEECDWKLEYCGNFQRELDFKAPSSTIWDYEKSLNASSVEKSVGDASCSDEFSELQVNPEEIPSEKDGSDSQSPKSDKTSDDEIEELFHLPPEEFDKQTANDSTLTDGLDRWNPKSKEPTRLGGECHGLGNTIFHLWEGSNGRPLPSQFGRNSFWPVSTDTAQDVKNWISEQASHSVAKWVSKQSSQKLEHPSPIHVVFNHDENSSFVTYIPVPEARVFSSSKGCQLSPKSEGEDPLKCEDLLHSEATHFAPINPDLGDEESNYDTEASISALEKSATNIKAKKKDSNRTEKNPETQKLTVKESLLSAPLSLLDIERCSSLDAQLEEERKIIRSGYKSKTAVDRGTNTEAPIASPIIQKHLDPILELVDNGEPPLAAKLEDLIAFQRDKRIWGHGFFNNVDSASISSYGMGINFRQASWSTSDGADETDSNSASGYEDPFNVEELVNTPEPNITKDGNNNDTAAEVKVDQESEGAPLNSASFDDEEVFELLRIQEEIPTELYSEENADVSTEEFEVDNELPAIPTNNALYSSELEDEWHRLSQPFDIQVPRKSTIVKLGDDWHSPHRRPCSFYLEGNCRRSDCKFSHDLSTITCRFWEEGSCFKGVTCPFLHGYSSYPDRLSPLPFTPPISEEIQTRVVSSPAPPKWNFKLESEKDFPSLSASSLKETESHPNSLPLSSSSNDSKSIKKIGQTRKEGGFGRIIRPKKSKKSFSNQLPISLSRNEIKQQHQESLGKKKSTINRNDNTLKT